MSKIGSKLEAVKDQVALALKALLGKAKKDILKAITDLDRLQPQLAQIIAKSANPDRASKSVIAAVKAELNRLANKLIK